MDAHAQFLSRQSRLATLNQARNTLLETEVVAEETLQNLSVQEEQIRQATIKTHDTKQQLDQSNTLLQKMRAWWRG